MPAIRNRTVLTLARNVSAFFNLEAGVTRPENLATSETAQDGENAALREQLESRRRQLADKDAEIQRLQARLQTLVEAGYVPRAWSGSSAAAARVALGSAA